MNSESAILTGLSYQLKANPWLGTQLLFSHAIERIRHDAQRLRESAPPNSFSLGWVQRINDDWSATLLHYRVGAIEWLEFGERIAPYQRTDARIAHRVRVSNLRGDLSLAGQNLFGSYNEFRNGPPEETHRYSRRIFATLRFDY